MKKIVCSLLAGSVFFATACSNRSSSKEPAPSKPATKDQIESSNNKIEAEGNASANSNGSAKSVSLLNNALNSTIKSLMSSNDMYIKDFAGKDVDLETYKLNPTQYFLIFKKKDAPGTSYVLKTSASETTAASSQVDLTFDVFTLAGDMSAFKGSSLGEVKLSEKLTLHKSPLMALQNKANIQALMSRIEGAKISQNNGVIDSVNSFLFPTAYATSYADKLLYTAITFTAIAVTSYIFAWYWVGNISTAGGIVFWLLYAFEV